MPFKFIMAEMPKKGTGNEKGMRSIVGDVVADLLFVPEMSSWMTMTMDTISK